MAGNKYVLVHAGLDHFHPERDLDDYELYEMAFSKVDYNKVYFEDKYLVTGHVPTRNILDNSKPDYIYKANHHIAMDCGSGYDGQLGCICLDTWTEYYSKK